MTLPAQLSARDRSTIAHPPTPIGSVVGGPVLVLVAVVAIVVVWATTIIGRATPGPRTTLPAAARGPVSAALGRDQGEYRVVGNRIRNRAQGIAATFAPGGVTITKGTARARLGLVGYGRGSAVRTLGPAVPQAQANRVDYVHPGVRDAKARLTCAGGPCAGQLVLRRKGRTLGSGRFRIADGATATVTLRLASAAARLLVTHASLKVTATVTGATGRATAAVALRRAGR